MFNPVPFTTIITCSAHFCDMDLVDDGLFEAILFLVCASFPCTKQFYLRHLISSAALDLFTSVISRGFVWWEIFRESSFTLSSDLLWSGFIWWEMAWGHLIPGMRFIPMHKQVAPSTSSLCSFLWSSGFCLARDDLRPSYIGMVYVNMWNHINMCSPVPSSTSDLDLMTCSGHFCDLDCWLEMVWGYLILGMHWMHLYI